MRELSPEPKCEAASVTPGTCHRPILSIFVDAAYGVVIRVIFLRQDRLRGGCLGNGWLGAPAVGGITPQSFSFQMASVQLEVHLTCKNRMSYVNSRYLWGTPMECFPPHPRRTNQQGSNQSSLKTHHFFSNNHNRPH